MKKVVGKKRKALKRWERGMERTMKRKAL